MDELLISGSEPLTRIIRYLRNLVAWKQATDYVCAAVRPGALRTDVLALRLMDTSPPSPIEYLPTKCLLNEAIELIDLSETISRDDHHQMLIDESKLTNDDLNSRVRFTGTVHCEAALMALTIDDTADPLYEVSSHRSL